MANQSHLDILRQGIKAWNSWREQNPSIKPDLSGEDLSGAILMETNLTGANLSRARLSKANLMRANLSRANLSDADLSEANLLGRVNLSGADLSRADLSRVDATGADLSGADLPGARLFGAKLPVADLSGADLTDADLSDTDLADADLSGAKLPNAKFRLADLRRTDLSGADLSGADFTYCTFVRTILEGATLTGCRIYGTSAWNLKLEGAIQHNLNVSDANEPAIMVDNLEVAQFIYLLLNHKKLRDILNAITERGVLILGRFGGGGLEVLEAIAAKLRESNYQPFIFDFNRPADRNYTETVKTLVGLSRFVIVDLSGPSVPQELYATVPHFKIPFVPIIEEGRRQYSMAVDILEYPWVLNPPVRFVDAEHLVSEMPTQIIAPAEQRVKDRQDRLADLFDA